MLKNICHIFTTSSEIYNTWLSYIGKVSEYIYLLYFGGFGHFESTCGQFFPN